MPPPSKYGIVGVGLNKNDKVITGCQWCYNYWDEDQLKVRALHSYDLRILREKVLEIGHDWIIDNNRLAIETYKYNNELIRMHDEYIQKNNARKYSTSSGVKYVTVQRDSRWNIKKYWKYIHNDVRFSSKSLLELESKVKESDNEWIIVDEERYLSNIRDEEKVV